MANLKQVPTVDTPVSVKNEAKDDYKVEVIRDYYGKVDPFYLSKKDPNYAYRFLRDEHKNLSIKTDSYVLIQKRPELRLSVFKR